MKTIQYGSPPHGFGKAQTSQAAGGEVRHFCSSVTLLNGAVFANGMAMKPFEFRNGFDTAA